MFMTSTLQQSAHYITIDGRELPIIITKNRRAKRLIMRYDTKLRAVKLTLPRAVSQARGLAFVASKEAWIASQQQALPQAIIPFAAGQKLPLLGHDVVIEHVAGRGLVRMEEGRLIVTAAQEFMARRVQDFVKRMLLDEIQKIIAKQTEKLPKKPARISLRETTSRWGSCSTRGTLSFCWRLAFAPYHVLEYVVCHELAHLTHHNHSKEYWGLLASMCSHVEESERWLKANGSSLWRFGL